MIAGRSLPGTRLPKPPRRSPKNGNGRIAQLVEQLTLNQRVLGSSPSASTIFSNNLAPILRGSRLKKTAAKTVDRSPGGRDPLRLSLAPLRPGKRRSEEHTSELQSLMRISYAVFCLKKKQNKRHENR